jgi:D-aminopeptidase
MKAECLPLAEAYRKVEQGACAAMKLIGKAKPFIIPKPSTIRWEFCRCAPADDAEGLPGVKRVGPRAVEKTVDHAGYSILPGLLRCQAYPGETRRDSIKVIGLAGKLPPGTVG